MFRILAGRRTLLILAFALFCAVALVLPAGASKRGNNAKPAFEFWEDEGEFADETREADEARRDRDSEAEREQSEARDYLGRRIFRSEEEREMLLATSPDDGAKEIRFRAVNTLDRLQRVIRQSANAESAAFVVAAAATLSPGNPTINFTGGPFLIPTNASDNANGPVTCDQTQPCEDFSLTVDFPQSYLTAHPNDQVKIEISWDDPSGGQDLDTWLVDNPDDGTYPAHGSNGGDNPEVIMVPLSNIGAGAHNYFVRVAPFISTGQTYNGKISIESPRCGRTNRVGAPAIHRHCTALQQLRSGTGSRRDGRRALDRLQPYLTQSDVHLRAANFARHLPFRRMRCELGRRFVPGDENEIA
jgi:hypothetical protein